MAESARKKAFIDYYTANPDKLKGKSVYDAYAAMRREAGRQKKSPRAADLNSAIERRLGKTQQGRAVPSSSRVSPLAKGAKAVTDLPRKAYNALPSPGFGSKQNSPETAAASSKRSAQKKLEEAVGRRLTEGKDSESARRRIKYGQSRKA